MRMVQVQWFRKGQLLIPAVDDIQLKRRVPDMSAIRDMGSINKAKRESRAIQLANGGLGAGSVQVIR